MSLVTRGGLYRVEGKKYKIRGFFKDSDGKLVNFMVFENTKKKSEKSPDFNIVQIVDDEQEQSRQQDEPKEDRTSIEDVPF
jgi:hypothetical protein